MIMNRRYLIAPVILPQRHLCLYRYGDESTLWDYHRSVQNCRNLMMAFRWNNNIPLEQVNVIFELISNSDERSQ